MEGLRNDELVSRLHQTASDLGQILYELARRIGPSQGQKMLMPLAHAWIEGGRTTEDVAHSQAVLLSFLNEKHPPGQ